MQNVNDVRRNCMNSVFAQRRWNEVKFSLFQNAIFFGRKLQILLRCFPFLNTDLTDLADFRRYVNLYL